MASQPGMRAGLWGDENGAPAGFQRPHAQAVSQQVIDAAGGPGMAQAARRTGILRDGCQALPFYEFSINLEDRPESGELFCFRESLRDEMLPEKSGSTKRRVQQRAGQKRPVLARRGLRENRERVGELAKPRRRAAILG